MTELEPSARRVGRPRKYVPGRRNATIRFVPDQYAAVQDSAQKNGRSFSEEAESRIAQSLTNDRLEVIQQSIDEVRRIMAATKAAWLDGVASPPVSGTLEASEAPDTAFFTGTHASSGVPNVAAWVPVSRDQLQWFIHHVIRLETRVDQLEKSQPSEETVERVVERAFAKTFAGLGRTK